MQHSFDVDIAAEYGVNCAILLNHIWFWCEKNRANGKHLHDGTYWTYNSVKAFEELFPYMGKKAIRNALTKLESEELIISGCFNKDSYDRTKWYGITHKGLLHLSKGEKGIVKKGEPIPDIKPDIKLNIYSFSSSNSNLDNLNTLVTNSDYKYKDYISNNTQLIKSIEEWMEYKDHKKPRTSNHYETERGMCKFLTGVVERDMKFGTDAVVKEIDKAIANNWQGVNFDNLDRFGKPVKRKPEPKKVESKEPELTDEEQMRLFEEYYGKD